MFENVFKKKGLKKVLKKPNEYMICGSWTLQAFSPTK